MPVGCFRGLFALMQFYFKRTYERFVGTKRSRSDVIIDNEVTFRQGSSVLG